jgi:hypothetical protein
MDEQHVCVAIPVANVSERDLRARDGLTREIHIVDAPGVSTVMVEVKLLRCPDLARLPGPEK